MKRNTIWLGGWMIVLLAGAIILTYLPDHSPTDRWLDVSQEVTEALNRDADLEPPVKTLAPAGSARQHPAAEPIIGGTSTAEESSTTDETSTAAIAKPDYIDLNTASAEQLISLPGIGPAKAQAIIDYRTQSGPFTTIEQLMKVKGIGLKTFEKLKDKIGIQ
jgi:comEA protein